MATAEPKFFVVTVHGAFEREEVPPRCRKPRPVQYEASTKVALPCITSDEAPVAFRVHSTLERTQDVRTYRGQLFLADAVRVAGEPDVPRVAGSGDFPAERAAFATVPAKSEEEFAERERRVLAEFLVVDGEVWHRIGEPRYEVCTFGLGSNHGGTAIMATFGDNANIAPQSYFRADDFKGAREYATRVALQRGDNESVARFRALIEVLDPGAVRLVADPPAPEGITNLRIEYGNATRELARADGPHAEEKAFEKVDRLRLQITDAGYSPVEANIRPYEDR